MKMRKMVLGAALMAAAAVGGEHIGTCDRLSGRAGGFVCGIGVQS